MGQTVGPALTRALPGQLAQIVPGVMTIGHDLFGVLVAQFVQAEVALAGNTLGFVEQCLGIKALQLRPTAKMLLGIGQASTTQLCHAAVMAQGIHHIMQGFAGRAMHLHIATGHQGKLQVVAQNLQSAIAVQFVVAQQVVHTDPHALAAKARKLAAVTAGALGVVAGQPDQQAALEMKNHIAQCHVVLALGTAPSSQADQSR